MRKLAILVTLCLFVYSCGIKYTNKDIANNVPIVTHIDIANVIQDRVPVIINPGRFTTDTITFYLPKVVQGTYDVSDFGKFIDDFKALNYKGEKMKVNRVDDNTWKIPNAKSLDKISYLVNDTFDVERQNEGNPFSPSGTNIESTNFVLNLHGFVGYFDILKNNSYTIKIKANAAIKRTAALPRIKSEKVSDSLMIDTYIANRYFDVTDNPMFYGNLDIEKFKVGDIEIVLSVYSPNKIQSAKNIKGTIFKMMNAQKSYLGDINSTPRYDIYLYLSDGSENAPQGFGALEHHTSTVVVLPESISDEQLKEAMVDVVSHEFFHIVTPLSVHSEDVHYFDYNNPTFSKHLWMYEGVTEYFANIFQCKQNLITEDDFYTKMMSKITGAQRYNDMMSFTIMSENILNKPYKDNYINVYEKGALIGMCLDILLREESNGDRSLLSLMKQLSLKYGRNKPFKDDLLLDEITEMTYPSIGDFFKKHVEGTSPIRYNNFLNKVGLTIAEKKVETSYIQNSGVLIVAGNPEKNVLYFTDLVAKNSFWADLNVQAYDEIIEINGEKVTLSNANTILSESFQWREGDPFSAKLNRNGKEILLESKIKTSYTQGKAIVALKNPTKKQLSIRKHWLKGIN